MNNRWPRYPNEKMKKNTRMPFTAPKEVNF